MGRFSCIVSSRLAAAIAGGVLRKDEVPRELLQSIAGLIQFYEEDQTA